MPGRSGFQAADDVGHPDEGPGGVMDGHEVGGTRGQGLQAVQDRLLPAGAARRPAAAGPGPRRPPDSRLSSPGGDHDLDAVDARRRPEGLQRCGAGRVGRPEGHIAWAGGRRSGYPGRRRRSGRCKSASAGLDNTEPTAAHSGPLAHARRDPLLLAQLLCTAQDAYKLISSHGLLNSVSVPSTSVPFGSTTPSSWRPCRA